MDAELEAFVTGRRVRARGFASPDEYLSHLVRQDREMDRIRRFLAGDPVNGGSPGFPGDCLQRMAERVRRW